MNYFLKSVAEKALMNKFNKKKKANIEKEIDKLIEKNKLKINPLVGINSNDSIFITDSGLKINTLQRQNTNFSIYTGQVGGGKSYHITELIKKFDNFLYFGEEHDLNRLKLEFNDLLCINLHELDDIQILFDSIALDKRIFAYVKATRHQYPEKAIKSIFKDIVDSGDFMNIIIDDFIDISFLSDEISYMQMNSRRNNQIIILTSILTSNWNDLKNKSVVDIINNNTTFNRTENNDLESIINYSSVFVVDINNRRR